MSSLITLDHARVLETPAATMRTYISPSTPRPAEISVWRTEMKSGVAGPAHTIDVDHTVVVVEGTLDAVVDGQRTRARAGDCVVLPAGAERQLTAGPEGVVTVTASMPGSTAQAGDGDPVLVPWAS